jgi:hypothetical protein
MIPCGSSFSRRCTIEVILIYQRVAARYDTLTTSRHVSVRADSFGIAKGCGSLEEHVEVAGRLEELSISL